MVATVIKLTEFQFTLTVTFFMANGLVTQHTFVKHWNAAGSSLCGK